MIDAFSGRTAGLLCILAAAMAATVFPSPAEGTGPSSNANGTLGLGQIVSAEAMGPGRLTLTARGNFYLQGREFPGAPRKDARIATGTAALGYGLNPYVDAFAGASFYSLSGSAPDNGSGPGTFLGGLQASMPFSAGSPGRLGLQVAVLAGAAGDPINANHADGYDYFETRTGLDASFKLTQSLLFGSRFPFRLHFNEGLATSLEKNRPTLLLQGAGLEFSPAPSLALGAEFHSRTEFKESRDGDPMWITPSLQFRGGDNHLDVRVGSELSLSGDRPGVPDRALEPWRIFGALTWSYDPKPGRDRATERARQDSLSRLGLEARARRAQDLADSLARKAREDSLARFEADAAARRRADSLAARALQDSLALAEARRNLENERGRRADWEKEFLRTGVLNLEALYFETGRAEISINSKAYLNLVGKMLSKYPKLRMEISGHTDNVGNAAANERLSQDRADAVRLYLTAAYSELQGRLSARGYGSAVPKTTNKTAEGRQINRRVEILVQNKEALKEYE